MISTKQLTYALAVQKTLHFKKAAELCHISQSALSTALGELERQLGLQIFERDNKKVLVTPIGQEVLDQINSIVLQINDLQRFTNQQDEALSYPLSIGAIPTIAPFLLPKLFPALYAKYPEAKIKIIENQSHTLVEMVKSGEIDTAILALPYPCDGLLALEFWQEDFYWITQADTEQSKKTEITSSEIDHKHLMLLNEGHCLKDHILDLCELSEKNTNNGHGFGAASLSTLIQMVLGKLGTTLIPAMALKQLTSQNSDLSAIHLNEASPHRRIAFIMRPTSSRMQDIEALIELCKQELTHD